MYSGARVLASTRGGTGQHLELVAMEMERVNGCVQIVNNDVDDLAVLGHEGMNVAVDDGVDIIFAGRGG